jgi:hypothetical protein
MSAKFDPILTREACEAYSQWQRGAAIWEGHFPYLAPYRVERIIKHGNTTTVAPKKPFDLEATVETLIREYVQAGGLSHDGLLDKIDDAISREMDPDGESYTIAEKLFDTLTKKPDDDPTSPWAVITAGDLKRRDVPKRESIMTEDGSTLFYESSVNQIIAWRGVGKTNFALGLCGAFCNGGTILDFKADRPRRVMYLDGELPLFQLQERARQLVGAEYEDNLSMFSPELLAEPRALNLLDAGDADHLKEALVRSKSEIVILDSQSTLMAGDSNKAEFQEARQRLLRELRWLNLCVIEMHHLGKTGQQRGLSRKR